MKKLLLVSAVGLALSGCGGGSGGGNGDNNGGSVTPPVTEPTVASVTGSIEDVNGNEITVNGLKFTVSNVKFNNIELEKFTFTDAMKNMVVRVDTAQKINAATVTLEPTMAGRINFIDEDKGIFSINGIQLVYSDLKTSGIDDGSWVLVSSLPTANAGYKVLSVVEIDVEHEYPGLANHYEIEGRIAQMNANEAMFVLGSNINVDYSNAALPHAGLKVGQWVEVEGHSSGDHFVATEVELDGYDIDDAFDDSDIEGIVTSVEDLHTSTPSFTLNYRGSFVTDSSTCYRLDDSYRCDANLKSKLKQGVEVEVTSKFVSGQRIASIIEFEQPDWDGNQGNWQGKEFECEGRVSNAIYSADTNELVSFTVSHCENNAEQIIADNEVIIDAQTRFENIDKMNINDAWVEVEGIIINDQNVARVVELED
ncbi:DUF5666 domain-containing protein [Vibrio alfacsensis]|uniref:DUF5666 domain-containing protein n=1 Tax=Vibrio alfacsensis TaxID=1074311 RepID=UPI004068228B